MSSINQILKDAVSKGASDVLLSVGKPPVFRIRGDLTSHSGMPPLNTEQVRQLLFPLLSESDLKIFEDRKEIDFSYEIDNVGRFRVNLYYQKGSPGGAFRMIPSFIPKLGSLGLPDIVHDFLRYKKGLVLVTGQTGSGKSTTLASIIDQINELRACHIITLEDPIEFVHQHKKAVVDQREIGNDTNSFTVALKHILRQDPDVVLIGEMRDIETIRSAITLAETGHLVFATLHTFDAAQTIDRIIDVFPAESQSQIKMQLSMVLQAILSQQLIPSTDGKRTMVCEILMATNALRSLIRDGKTHQIYSVMQTSSKSGMVTMNEALKRKVSDGAITKEMARAFSGRPDEFDDMMSGVQTTQQAMKPAEPAAAETTTENFDNTLDRIKKLKEKRELKKDPGFDSILGDDFKLDI